MHRLRIAHLVLLAGIDRSLGTHLVILLRSYRLDV
jgi:hypothetical protein